MSHEMPSTPTSEASTKVENDNALFSDDLKTSAHKGWQRAKSITTSRDILLFLIAFRLLNAFSIRTFFQPDEYFQSLEPAWQVAFGEDGGAWITWEWRYHLRSTIHPYVFAAGYWLAGTFSGLLGLSPAYRAELLLATPKIIQAHIAAVGDYYTWKLGEKIYGRSSLEAWACLALTVCSPWQWFCSTRTLSNCLETSLTIAALYHWPWQWSMEPKSRDNQVDGLRIEPIDEDEDEDEVDSEQPLQSVDQFNLCQSLLNGKSNLRYCLILAALACILRPTNIIVWASLTFFTLFQVTKHEKLIPFKWPNVPIMITVTWPELIKATRKERNVLIKEAALCGGLILFISAILDWTYYKQLTFPPLKFLYFNIAQSLAVFYGRNDWHYYLSQGYPLLLTTFLPFAALGLYDALRVSEPEEDRDDQVRLSSAILYQAAAICLLVPSMLSFISHKEVRFIYPILPLLHLICAPSAAACFRPALLDYQATPQPSAPSSPTVSQLLNNSRPKPWWNSLKPYRPTLLPLLLLLNIIIAIFTTQHHQRGVLSVMDYLRHEHETRYLTQPPSTAYLALADTTMTVGFLMPCHSTPWRSHLVHPSIKAWALGCEPPVHLPAGAEREAYLDEADRFYADPEGFLERELGRPRNKRLGGFVGFGSTTLFEGLGLDVDVSKGAWNGSEGRKLWPHYLVFFEGIENMVASIAAEAGYALCWRGWNSWFHDDWRRKGDVVVWCRRGPRGRLGE